MATPRIVTVRRSLTDSEFVVLEFVDDVDMDAVSVHSEFIVFEVTGDADQVTLCAGPRSVVFELVDDGDVAVAVTSDKLTSVALWLSDGKVLRIPRLVVAVVVSAESR